jgi:erythromycin esterase-like protein
MMADHLVESAIRLDATNWAPVDPGHSMLADIDRALARARIVLLGETNHFAHEKCAFRLWWLGRLARHRRLVLGEELSWSDGRFVSRYLASGDESQLDRLATFGHPGRADRDDRPTGILRASADAFPTALFKAAQVRFYRALRELEPRRFFGFDVGAPDATYEDIEARVDQVPDTGMAQSLRQLLARVPGESIAEEAERLQRAAEHAGRSGEPQLRALESEIASMAGSLQYMALAHPAPDYEALRPAMALREDLMKGRVERALAELAPDETLVLMAHAFHLARDDRRIHAEGIGPGGGLVPSLGHHLVQVLGLAPYAVWMLYGGGQDSQPFPDLPQHASYPPDALNSVLGSAGMPLVLNVAPLAEGALSRDVGVGHMYNQVVPVHLPTQADAIWYLPRITPMRDADAVAPTAAWPRD